MHFALFRSYFYLVPSILIKANFSMLEINSKQVQDARKRIINKCMYVHMILVSNAYFYIVCSYFYSFPTISHQVSFSMLEIYNEQVRDLLNPKTINIKGGLKVRQDPKGGFYGREFREKQNSYIDF